MSMLCMYCCHDQQLRCCCLCCCSCQPRTCRRAANRRAAVLQTVPDCSWQWVATLVTSNGCC